jgi:hypothetical protein
MLVLAGVGDVFLEGHVVVDGERLLVWSSSGHGPLTMIR